MPRKSNKTSYVMNLITNGEEEQGQEAQNGQVPENGESAQAPQDGPNAQGVQAASPNVAAAQTSAPTESEIKKVVVVDEDQESERLSEEIRGQLESELEAELKEQAETAQPSQETETAEQEPMETVSAAAEPGLTAPADTAVTETEIVEPMMDTEMNTVPETENMEMAADMTAATENMDTAADTTAAAESVDTEAKPAAQTESSNTTTQPTMPSQPGYRMVNVMETLVARVDLDKYIKEYGVCPCPRCRADVHALILTSLPSKYVVMDENAISLMLNFYESRRKTDIFTATLKACLEVKEHPRHDEETGQ